MARMLVEQLETRSPTTRITVQIGNAAWCAERVSKGGGLGIVVAATPGDMWSAPFAVDSVAFVVHRNNPLNGLTLSQLCDVLSGRVWHWSELGAAVAPDEITVVVRESGSGTRSALESAATAEGKRILEVKIASTAVVVPGSREVIEFVAAHKGAIGYVAGEYLQLGTGKVRALKIEGVPPTPERAARGSYPFVLPLFFIAPREPTGTARQLVDLSLSPKGQSSVAELLYPVRPLPRR